MKKNNLFYIGVISVTILLIFSIFLFASDKTNSRNIDFLKSYVWEVEKKPTEQVEILIPDVFDDVYSNYNSLQKEAGLDLSNYKGFPATRYTYILKNFPQETDQTVFANVICVDGIPVGGDICTVALDGFMYSLNFNTQDCFKNNLMDGYF